MLTILLLVIGSYISAQCITSTTQYPFNVSYTPATCDGTTINQIVTDGYAGEYSTVTVTAGITYTFTSSTTSDLITISTLNTTESNFVLAYGIGSVTWYATFSGDVKFYTNLNDGLCGEDQINRIRGVICNNAVSCNPPTDLMFSNLTTNSVNISWTASNSNPANGYEYYISSSIAPNNTTTPTGSVGAGITTVTINGLSINTSYKVWVRSACSSTSKSCWSSLRDFSTMCTPVTDFTENFDAALTFPDCWKRVGNGGATRIQADASATSAPNLIYLFGTNTTTSVIRGKAIVAIRPVSNAGDGTHRLRFKAKGNLTAGGVFEVGYLPNPAEASSFVNMQSFTTSSNSTYDAFTLLPGTAPGSSQVLAFRHSGTPETSILIDDVVWEVLPSCVEPTNLSVSNITLTGATISWTASISAPANGYQYYVSTSNVVPSAATTPTGSVVSGNTTVILTGLNSSTTYYFWVRAVCSITNSSEWSLSSNFNTLCTVSTVPYTQDFESALVPQMPICTTVQNVGTGNNWITVNNPSASTGFNSKTLQYNYSQTNAANTWFYTNAVTLSAGINYTISYKYGNNSLTFRENLKVSYGTAANAAAMTTILADHPNITGNTQTQNTVNFIPATSGDYYFGFNAYSIANQFFLFVDDISITLGLGNTSFNSSKFSVSPNPVKDIISISYDKTISNVAVYNLLGQQVTFKAVNADQKQIDLSNLVKGTYILKVSADDIIQCIKVIKE